MVVPIVVDALGTDSSQWFGKETRGIRNQGKNWFSDLEMLENKMERQDTNTITDTPNTEKQEHSNQNELQINNNWKTTYTNHTEQTPTLEEEINLENLKRIMYKKKTRLPSLRYQDWSTVKAETEKINDLLTHISMKNITELNKLIYAK